MPDDPFFTVVLATFNRGRHIVPTIESALDQTFADFELLVVGDGVTDDTFSYAPRHDVRVRCIALPWNSGGQATPNNVGIAAARGRYVAYLGHDDIWMPNHLAALAQLLEATRCDVAVSGCAYLGPPGTDRALLLTGLFEPLNAAQHFFPPTSIAHRAALSREIGGWRAPRTTVAPVDVDFLLRAAASGARFASTRQLTALKFAAGHRYLSYLNPSSGEQCDMLAEIRSGAFTSEVCARFADCAKAAGTPMISGYPDFASLRPGDLFRQNRSNKGIDRAAPVPLLEEVYVEQSMEPRALDWYPAEQPDGRGSWYRWSGPSLRPKLLIPFTGDVVAQITLHLRSYDPEAIIGSIHLSLNGDSVEHTTHRDHPDRVDLKFSGSLLAEAPSVLELMLARSFCPADVIEGSVDKRRLGVILTGFTILPTKTAADRFSTFLLKALVRRVNRRMLIRMVKFCRSTKLVETSD